MPSRGRRFRVIALMNQKGGVGKTTTAVNLSAALARRGRHVLLADLDPQAHATLHVGLDPDHLERSVYDVLTDPSDPPHLALQQVADRLLVLPAETDLAAAESELAGEPDRQSRLDRAFERLEEVHDLAIIDCPPSLGLLTINALAAADAVLIPMQAHFLALHGVGKLLETVRLLAESVNPDLKVLGVVLCSHDSQATHTREVVADLEQFFADAAGSGTPWDGAQVFMPPIRRNIKLAECPSFGETIFDYAPGAPGAEDYDALAKALLDAGVLAPPERDRAPEVHVVDRQGEHAR